jgi:hypothetical protein
MTDKDKVEKAHEEYEAMDAARKLTAGNMTWLDQVLSNLDPEQAESKAVRDENAR